MQHTSSHSFATVAVSIQERTVFERHECQTPCHWWHASLFLATVSRTLREMCESEYQCGKKSVTWKNHTCTLWTSICSMDRGTNMDRGAERHCQLSTRLSTFVMELHADRCESVDATCGDFCVFWRLCRHLLEYAGQPKCDCLLSIVKTIMCAIFACRHLIPAPSINNRFSCPCLFRAWFNALQLQLYILAWGISRNLQGQVYSSTLSSKHMCFLWTIRKVLVRRVQNFNYICAPRRKMTLGFSAVALSSILSTDEICTLCCCGIESPWWT